MPDTVGVVRVAFYDKADFLISSENLKMTDSELRDYIDVLTSDELPDAVHRVALYSRDRPFRKLVIDRRKASNMAPYDVPRRP